MKVFFSYGHDNNTEIVLLIKKSLEELGYETWVDTSKIKGSADWRRSIEQGIHDCTVVVSFLSKYSVREPGVCLDELAIALSDGSKTLVTILLEDFQKVNPPAFIKHIQPFDLSNWKQKKKHKNLFKSWYNKQLTQIIDAIESRRDEINDIQNFRSYFNFSSLEPDYISRANFLLKKGFVGREWLLDIISDQLSNEETMRDSCRNVLCLTAGPGYGKSSFVAHLAASRQLNVCAVHFCNQGDRVQDIFLNIVYQMGLRIRDYRASLLRILKEYGDQHTLSALSSERLFQMLFVDRTNLLVDGTRQKFYIIIDGVDEIDEELTRLIVKNGKALPQWLRMIITSRPNEQHIKPHLDALYSISLLETDERNIRDAYLWINTFLTSKFKSKFDKKKYAKKLLAASEGSFLYLNAFKEMIEHSPSLLVDAEAYPKGLSSLFYTYLNRLFPNINTYKLLIRPILKFIIAAKYPFPINLIINISRYNGLNFSASQIFEDFIPALQSLIIEEKNEIRIFHKSFSDWLISPSASYYRLDISSAHESISKYLISNIINNYNDITNHMGQYELRSFGYHFLHWVNVNSEMPLFDKHLSINRMNGLNIIKKFLDDQFFSLYKWTIVKKECFQTIFAGNKHMPALIHLEWKMATVYFDLLFYGVRDIETIISCFDVTEIQFTLGYFDYSKDNLEYITSYEGFNGLDQSIKCKVLNLLSLSYIYLGQYSEARGILASFLPCGDLLEDINRSIISNSKGMSCRLRGEYDQALNYYHSALFIRLLILGDRHSATGDTLHNIGTVYIKKQHYDLAKNFLEMSFDITRNNYPYYHTSTATSLNNLGLLYTQMGEYELAKVSLNEARKIRSVCLHELHFDVATTHNNIGLLYYCQGNYIEAEQNFLFAIDILERSAMLKFNDVFNKIINGRWQLEVVRILSRCVTSPMDLLDSLQIEMEKLSEINADTTLIEALNELITAKANENRHPQLAGTFYNLAHNYYFQGNYCQAKISYQKAIKLYEEYAPTHPDLAIANELLSTLDKLA